MKQKIKKIITSFALACSLAFAPLNVSAEPTKITGSSTATTNGTTNINYTVSSVVTVEIPESIELKSDNLNENPVIGNLKIYGNTSDDNVIIEPDKKVYVSITNSEKGGVDHCAVAITANGSNQELNYCVDGKNKINALKDIAICAPNSKLDSQQLKFSFESEPKPSYAGTYTDTLTFTVEIKKAE